jgi:hypothetical protein
MIREGIAWRFESLDGHESHAENVNEDEDLSNNERSLPLITQ